MNHWPSFTILNQHDQSSNTNVRTFSNLNHSAALTNIIHTKKWHDITKLTSHHWGTNMTPGQLPPSHKHNPATPGANPAPQSRRWKARRVKSNRGLLLHQSSWSGIPKVHGNHWESWAQWWWMVNNGWLVVDSCDSWWGIVDLMMMVTRENSFG